MSDIDDVIDAKRDEQVIDALDKKDAEIKHLRAEIERLEREREEIIRSRDMYHDLSSLLQTEIERKDESLMECASSADSIRFHCGHGGDLDIIFALAGDIMNQREQALQNKEESDEHNRRAIDT